MDNYEYCATWVTEHIPSAAARVLDYGCGDGRIVGALRELGVEAYGCDVFYQGGDVSRRVPAGMFGSVIRRMEGGRIPFEDQSFDIVTSNQVIEHVEDLESVVAELARVTKPGGFIMSLFPDKSSWREVHCGIPFLHRFPKGSTSRVYYAALLRLCGLGNFKNGKRTLQWSRDFCTWLDDWTFYRPIDEVKACFLTRFESVTEEGDAWLRRRFGGRAMFLGVMPHSAQLWVAARGGCRALVARR